MGANASRHRKNCKEGLRSISFSIIIVSLKISTIALPFFRTAIEEDDDI